MSFTRVLLLLVGLAALVLLVLGLVSSFGGGSVAVPGVGLVMGGLFLAIVGLVIAAGAFLGFLRMKKR